MVPTEIKEQADANQGNPQQYSHKLDRLDRDANSELNRLMSDDPSLHATLVQLRFFRGGNVGYVGAASDLHELKCQQELNALTSKRYQALIKKHKGRRKPSEILTTIREWRKIITTQSLRSYPRCLELTNLVIAKNRELLLTEHDSGQPMRRILENLDFLEATLIEHPELTDKIEMYIGSHDLDADHIRSQIRYLICHPGGSI